MKENASRLKQEAEAIIDELDILAFLRSYGRTEVVGSVVLDLIVKRDIDIHLLLQPPDDIIAVAQSVVGELLKKKQIETIRLSKYYGDSINVAIDSYRGPSGAWSVDVWLTINPERAAFEKTKRLNEILTAEQREIIMHLKRHMHKHNLLRDGMSSIIYHAVMNHNVSSVDDFEIYLKSSKK